MRALIVPRWGRNIFRACNASRSGSGLSEGVGLLSTAAKAALQEPTIQVGTLVELDFSFGVERFWTGTHELTFEGESYQPVGDLGRISPLESTQDLKANGLTLSVTIPHSNGEPVPRFQNVRPEQYKNRPARTILAFFDEKFTTIVHSLERNYFMDVLSYSVDPSASSMITLNVESELMAGAKRSVKRLTDEQQRDDYPDDVAFQFLSYLSSGVEIKWGTAGAFFK